MKHLKTFEEFVESISEERVEIINEVADWDNPKLKQKDKATISCDDDEAYEIEPIRRAVRKTYPNIFTDAEIEAAIGHCCKKEGQSREREDFYQCVYDRLFEML